MTSTSEFFGQSATLTVHRPPGSAEAVLMIETMDAVASITLSRDEVRRLTALLQQHGPASETSDRFKQDFVGAAASSIVS